MKYLVIVLVIILAVLQYQFWGAQDGLLKTLKLKKTIRYLIQSNEVLAQKNFKLSAEIQSLKKGTNAIELRARSEIGMIKSGETFYHVIR